MENDAEQGRIHPILLDINQIAIESVTIMQLESADVDDHLPHSVEFVQTLKNGGKLLELELSTADLKFAETVRLSVVIEFVSQITNTLQGIYKVDYKDDYAEKEE